MLKKHLGSAWQQLAKTMGLPNGPVDGIVVEHPKSLPMQIDTFLETYTFPSLGGEKEAADFLVETLVRVSLPQIALAVKRDLEFKLGLEGIQFFCTHLYVVPSQ